MNVHMMQYANSIKNFQGTVSLSNEQNKMSKTSHIATDLCKFSYAEFKIAILRKPNETEENTEK